MSSAARYLSFDINGILILVEEKVLTEPEDEIPDVVYNLLLQYAFIYIFDVTGIQLLRVNEVQQILILESTESTAGTLCIGNGCEEVVRQGAVLMKIIFCY